MDIHRKPVDMDMDMDGKFHIHGKPGNIHCRDAALLVMLTLDLGFDLGLEGEVVTAPYEVLMLPVAVSAVHYLARHCEITRDVSSWM